VIDHRNHIFIADSGMQNTIGFAKSSVSLEKLQYLVAAQLFQGAK
jgi:hypothetical protein